MFRAPDNVVLMLVGAMIQALDSHNNSLPQISLGGNLCPGHYPFIPGRRRGYRRLIASYAAACPGFPGI